VRDVAFYTLSNMFMINDAIEVNRSLKQLFPKNWIYFYDISTILVEMTNYYEGDVLEGDDVVQFVQDLLYYDRVEEDKVEALKRINLEEVDK